MESTKNTTQNTDRMGSMPIGKLLISMSLPMIFSMLIQACYNIVDSIFVAQLGDQALNAVTLSFPVQMFIIAFSVGIGVGMNSLISRRLGENRIEDAKDAALNGLLVQLIGAIVFLILGLLFARPFFTMFTDDAVVVEMGGSYLTICMALCVGTCLQISTERIMVGMGKATSAMIIQIIGAVINIILDPILIFGLFGMPKMGITGAAVATVTGQIIAMVFGLYLVFAKKHIITFTLKGFRPNGKSIREILSVGLPAMIMQSIASILTLGFNAILVGFTPIAVNVLGVYFRLNSFAFMPVFGICNAAMSILAYNFGAGNKKRLIQTWKLMSIFCFTIMTVGMIVFISIPQVLLGFFEASPEMLEIGIPAFRTICLNFPVAAICITTSTLFQALGKGMYSLWMSILRQLVIILPLAYIFSITMGLNAVWWSVPISEVVAAFICWAFAARVYKTMIEPLGDGEDLQPK